MDKHGNDDFLYPENYLTKGNELYKKGDFEGALEYYNKALHMDPHLYEALFNRALAYTRLNQYFRAQEDLNKCLEKDHEKDYEIYYTRGLVKEYRQRYAQAALDYCIAYSKNTDYKKAIDQLELCVERAMGSGKQSRPAPSSETDDEKADIKPFIEESDLTLADYGGDSEQKELIKNVILFFSNKDKIRKRGGAIPGGILLYGEPGTGKTYLAKIVANELNATFFNVKASQIMSVWYGRSERNMQKLFDVAAREDYAVIFIDEIDSIALSRDRASLDAGVERRTLSQLLMCMDGISEEYSNILVIGATNDFDALDKAILRPGRFDHQIEIKKPNVEALISIYEIQINMIKKKAEESLISDSVDYHKLAKASEGLVGDDIKEIVERCVNTQIIKEIELSDKREIGKIDTAIILNEIENYKEMREDNKRAKIGSGEDYDDPHSPERRDSARRKRFKPYIEKSSYTLDDYGGDSEQKDLIRDLFLFYSNRDLIQKRGGAIPGGILLYGEPGTGKTYLAKIVANELNATFFNTKASDLIDMYVGESEKNIQMLFDIASEEDNAVIFIDEIDAIGQARGSGFDSISHRSALSQLLICMDGLSSEKYQNVLLIAATNDFEALDNALKRPGRFDHQIEIKKPNVEALKNIIEIQIRMTKRKAAEPLISDEIDYEMLAKAAEGLVGDEIKEIIERCVNNQIIKEVESPDDEEIEEINTETILEQIITFKEGEKDKRLKIGFY